LDWTTDKHHVIDYGGHERYTDIEPFNFKAILKSIVLQFEWHTLFGLEDESKFESACAQQLRAGRYLIAIDNLETLPDAEQVAERLRNMIIPLYSHQPLSSWAFLTSREQIENPHSGRLSIQGIEPQALEAYVRYLENAWDIGRPLTSEQCQALAVVANRGNNPPGVAQLTLYEAAYAPGTRRLFTGHTDAVRSVVVSPDGKTALSASQDTLILWDVATGQAIRSMQGPSGPDELETLPEAFGQVIQHEFGAITVLNVGWMDYPMQQIA
jgi:WD40 repeat protein